MKKINKILLILITIFITLLFYVIDNYQKNQSTDNLIVYFYDVSQGDSIHIRKGKTDILVDGGPSNNILFEISKVMPFFEKDIEYIILTHPHSDHLSGLIDILGRYNVGQIFLTDAVSSSNEYLEFLSIIKDKNISTKLARQGDIINIDEVEINFLWPEDSYSEITLENLNDSSIVSKITYGDIDFILTGDAESNVQDKILNKYSSDFLNSEILKVAHHGSKDSNNTSFLQNVKPEISVICVGLDNKFSHPDESTIKNLNNINSKILRTDLSGTIKIISDGKNYWTETGK